MKFDWEVFELGKITEWYSGGTPALGNPLYWDGEVPWISASSMQGNRYDSSNRTITREGLKYGSRLAEENTILLLARGNILQKRVPVGIAMTPVAFNQDVKAIKAKDIIDPWFLLYWLMGHEKELLKLVNFTSIGAGKLDVGSLQKLPINLPPLSEQIKIATVAKAIDDKIESNLKINDTLEEVAQALFNSWFVDFDVVKEKSIGNKPKGMDKEVCSLFPSSFVDSELGVIPKGWKVCSIRELVDFNPKRSLRKGEIAPYLDVKNVSIRGHLVEGMQDKEVSNGIKFKNGDTLFARLTPHLENGRVTFVDFLNEDQVGWGSTEYITMRSKDPYSLEFSYYLARHNAFINYAIQSSTRSSSRQRLDVNSLESMLWVNPGIEIMREFSKITNKIMQKIKCNRNQNKTLTSLRDTILPKLLSGEVSVLEVNEQEGM